METVCMPPVTGLRNGLIAATSQASRKESVYKKYFHHHSLTISLRPFCIMRDMPAIYGWIWKLRRTVSAVAVSYLYADHSDFTRSFMVVVNNRTPVCQIDISNANKDELYELYPASTGDYIIRLVMNTNKKSVRDLHIKALQTSLEYFFLFPEIRKIIAQPEADNKLYNEILYRSGFQFEDQVYNQYTLCNVFVCTRESFSEAISQKP
jgi:hypothetical protein